MLAMLAIFTLCSFVPVTAILCWAYGFSAGNGSHSRGQCGSHLSHIAKLHNKTIIENNGINWHNSEHTHEYNAQSIIGYHSLQQLIFVVSTCTVIFSIILIDTSARAISLTDDVYMQPYVFLVSLSLSIGFLSLSRTAILVQKLMKVIMLGLYMLTTNWILKLTGVTHILMIASIQFNTVYLTGMSIITIFALLSQLFSNLSYVFLIQCNIRQLHNNYSNHNSQQYQQLSEEQFEQPSDSYVSCYLAMIIVMLIATDLIFVLRTVFADSASSPMQHTNFMNVSQLKFSHRYVFAMRCGLSGFVFAGVLTHFYEYLARLRQTDCKTGSKQFLLIAQTLGTVCCRLFVEYF